MNMRVVGMTALGLVAVSCATTVPPPGQSDEKPGPGELAIYASAHGKTTRLGTRDLPGGLRAFYSDRSRRLEKEGDVLLRCSGLGACDVLAEASWREFTPSAVQLASRYASADRAYPFDITISFRILSTPAPTHINWTPQRCPEPGVRTPENERLKRAYKIRRACTIPDTMPPEAQLTD